MKTKDPPVPFRRPRLLSEAARVQRMQRGNRGLCFEFAWKEAAWYAGAKYPRPALTVMHGLVQGGIEHAWIERGGWAYDWQAFAIHGWGPVPIAEFYARNAPTNVVRYTARRAMAAVSRTHHSGPWPKGEGR